MAASGAELPMRRQATMPAVGPKADFGQSMSFIYKPITENREARY
jgi:hypothetical protein